MGKTEYLMTGGWMWEYKMVCYALEHYFSKKPQ